MAVDLPDTLSRRGPRRWAIFRQPSLQPFRSLISESGAMPADVGAGCTAPCRSELIVAIGHIRGGSQRALHTVRAHYETVEAGEESDDDFDFGNAR